MAGSSAAATPESNSGLILRARLVLPVTSPPIPNGAVMIVRKKIAAVSHWRDFSRHARRNVIDLGDSILMPGLINAHCHLDYTDMAGLLPPPKRFTDWLQSIVSVKAHWMLSDYRASWKNGAAMLLRAGTTCVADIEAFPELLPEAWSATPLRVISFLEMIGLSGRRDPNTIVAEAAERISRLHHGRCRAGLSPHAPYSTLPALLRLSAQIARKRRWLLCTHIAESAEEFEMFTRGRGRMFDWLKQSGRDISDCGSISPVRYMDRSGALGQNVLAVHANYLRRGDAGLLADRKTSVVHCPRSHAYFGHGAFPLKHLLRRRVNVCLGTDSLATVFKRRGESVELSMFAEMREFALNQNAPSPKLILRMATVNGARALGRGGQIGELKTGALADLIALPFNGKTTEAYEAVTRNSGHVTASMIGGHWAIEPK